jgi:Uma2 family endonuclease
MANVSQLAYPALCKKIMLDAIEEHRYTYGDYVRWEGKERWELIGGEAFLMSPAPSSGHQELVSELLFQLRLFLRGKSCRALVAPIDVRLPKAAEADDAVDTVVQPDLVVVCDSTKIDRAGVRGAPDLVIEVISPSTAVHDQVLKLALYEKAGVRGYWIVDGDRRSITVYRRAGKAFAPAGPSQDLAFESAVLPGFRLDAAALFPGET